MTSLIVRAQRPEDRDAIRRIACDTALYGEPIDSVIQDRALVADSLVGYYLEFEPEASFVAEENRQVIGYLTGCLDTRRYEQIYKHRILPHLLWNLLYRGHLFRPKTWRLLITIRQISSTWAQFRHSVISLYPAHCHINLTAGSRHAGTGSALLETFLSHLRSQRVPGIHIVSATEPGKSFFGKAGFVLLEKYPSPSPPGIPSKEAWIMGKRLC